VSFSSRAQPSVDVGQRKEVCHVQEHRDRDNPDNLRRASGLASKPLVRVHEEQERAHSQDAPLHRGKGETESEVTGLLNGSLLFHFLFLFYGGKPPGFGCLYILELF